MKIKGKPLRLWLRFWWGYVRAKLGWSAGAPFCDKAAAKAQATGYFAGIDVLSLKTAYQCGFARDAENLAADGQRVMGDFNRAFQKVVAELEGTKKPPYQRLGVLRVGRKNGYAILNEKGETIAICYGNRREFNARRIVHRWNGFTMAYPELTEAELWEEEQLAEAGFKEWAENLDK